RAYCLKTQPATGETYPKSDLFNKAIVMFSIACCRVVLEGIALHWQLNKCDDARKILADQPTRCGGSTWIAI
ncbi:hypothetical protein, partial [Klebsiella pneumoniae]|uniref:hypothetical protein n=1 Tax=Klebsiella pneumoniae TaxID=573 RepID=UPI001F48B0D2